MLKVVLEASRRDLVRWVYGMGVLYKRLFWYRKQKTRTSGVEVQALHPGYNTTTRH